jgi:hypothetical protein
MSDLVYRPAGGRTGDGRTGKHDGSLYTSAL